MGKILRIDGSSGNAYAQIAFASAANEYVQFCAYFPAATLTDPAVQGSWIDLVDISLTGGGYLDGLFLAYDAGEWKWWWEYGPGGAVGSVSPDQWYTLAWRVSSSGQRELRIDGVELAAYDSGQLGAAGELALGNFGFGGVPGVWYYDDAKIGSSGFGSANIFEDDFEIGDLSTWDSSFGLASVVSDSVTGGGCSGGGISVSASPIHLTAVESGSDSTTVTVSSVTESVALSISGLPAGVTAGFVPNPVSAPGSSTLTLSVAPGTTPGTYSLTITGTGASGSDTATITLTVIAGANTTCAAAASITGAEGSVIADNTGANDWSAPDPLFHDEGWGLGYGGGGPLWWKYHNSRTKPVYLRLFIDPEGTVNRANFGIFRGECGSLHAEDCHVSWGYSGTSNGYVLDTNVPGNPLFDYVDAFVHPGETVYIEVDGYSGDTSEPPTLGPPNRGRFSLRWEVHDVSVPGDAAFDAIEESDQTQNPFSDGCGNTYSEPTSRVGGIDDTRQSRIARAHDYVEFAGDSWYTALYVNEIEILDHFDAGLGSWTNPFLTSFGGSSPMSIVSGALKGTASGTGLSTAGWNTSLGADQEVGALVLDTAQIGTSNYYRLFLRMDAGGSTGYMCRFGGPGGGIVISRLDGGAGATTLGSGGISVGAGERIRFQAVGNDLFAQILSPGSSNWRTIVAVTDATYNRAGYVGVGIVGTSRRIDDFSAAESPDLGHELPLARVHRWDGSAVTEYVLPILGVWEQTEIQLNSDGDLLWAVTSENGGSAVANPAGGTWAPAYPVVFQYDPGTDAFVRAGTMTAKAANVHAVGFSGLSTFGGGQSGWGHVGGIDSTAHPSMPGRVYVVWSEKGMSRLPIYPIHNISPPGEEQRWIEHVAIGCFGPDAPFAEFDIGYSDTRYGDAYDNWNGTDIAQTAIGDEPYWTPTGRNVLVNDQGVCHLFRIEVQNPDGPFSGILYQKDYVRCEQVEDAGSLTLKRIVNYVPPPGLPFPPGDRLQATHLSVEPICHAQSGGGFTLQGDSWVFVVLGSDFPGNHPDYDFLIANGVSGVLWRSDTGDPDLVAGMASTRAAGLQAGIWIVAGNSELASDYAARAISDVSTYAPDLLVMDNEVVAKGYDPSPGWTWSEDVMAAYRAGQPYQRTAVTMLPNQDDFNYAAYTSRGVGIWPQSYGANIPADDIPPMDVVNRVIANGVDPAVVKAVLPYDPWSTDVEILRANGIYTFAVFTAEGMQAEPGGGTPPDPPTESPATELARTVVIGWTPNGSVGTGFAYNFDPLLEAPERWYNENAAANGDDVIVNVPWTTGQGPDFYYQEPINGGGGGRRTIYTDRFNQTWIINGFTHVAWVFDRKCTNAWRSMNLPREGDSFFNDFTDTLLDFMSCGRQMVFDEAEDVIRSSTWYRKEEYNPAAVQYYEHLAVSHLKVKRSWVICSVPGPIIGPESGLPFMSFSFKARESAHAAASTTDFGPLHIQANFKARGSVTGEAPVSPSDTSPLHLSHVRFRV